MKIESGTGNGKFAMVNDENRLSTTAVSEPHDRHLARTENTTWSLPFEAIDPVGADDYFFYIKNTGANDIAITDIRLESSVAGNIEVHHVTGTPSFAAGADITPVNRYLGSSINPTATIKTDTDTTGLTSGGIVFFLNIPVVSTLYHLRTSSNIFIAPGQQLALLWTSATGILSGVVSITEHSD